MSCSNLSVLCVLLLRSTSLCLTYPLLVPTSVLPSLFTAHTHILILLSSFPTALLLNGTEVAAAYLHVLTAPPSITTYHPLDRLGLKILCSSMSQFFLTGMICCTLFLVVNFPINFVLDIGQRNSPEMA